MVDGDGQASRDRSFQGLLSGTGRKHEELGRELSELEQTPPDMVTAMDDPIGDDVLRLIFVSASHPCDFGRSEGGADVAGWWCGLTTDEIGTGIPGPRSQLLRSELCVRRRPWERSASCLSYREGSILPRASPRCSRSST